MKTPLSDDEKKEAADLIAKALASLSPELRESAIGPASDEDLGRIRGAEARAKSLDADVRRWDAARRRQRALKRVKQAARVLPEEDGWEAEALKQVAESIAEKLRHQ